MDVIEDQLRTDVRRLRIVADREPLTLGEFFEGLADSAALRALLTEALRALPFEAVQWETPPLSSSTAGEPFECVVLRCSILEHATPEPHIFAEHFQHVPDDVPVVDFENLGRDARLVVPVPHGGRDDAHLLRFLRHASDDTAHALWRRVGEISMKRSRATPVWISTAGQGVHWLHVRFDAAPKYTRYKPYLLPSWPVEGLVD